MRGNATSATTAKQHVDARAALMRRRGGEPSAISSGAVSPRDDGSVSNNFRPLHSASEQSVSHTVNPSSTGGKVPNAYDLASVADLGKPTETDGIEPRWFFIHVMKTAGTTFSRELKQQFAAESIYPCAGIDYESPTSAEGLESYIKIPRLLSLPPARRAGVKVYTGHFPYWVCAALDPDLVTMTLLREPVERSLAALRHFKRDPAYRHLSLDQIYDDRVVFRFYVENHQTKVFGLGPDDNEDAINCGLTIDDARFSRAKENLASVDVIGLTEAYREFIDEIRARFGWWPAGVDANRRENASREGWTAVPELRERIEADNAYDMRLYGYAKELIARRRDDGAAPDPA
jgi:hypothetical protein